MSGDGREWAPSGINTKVASAARVYDYVLGGKTHFPADGEVAEAMVAAYPQARTAIVANRQFLVRAVEFLAQSARCGPRSGDRSPATRPVGGASTPGSPAGRWVPWADDLADRGARGGRGW